MFQFLIGISNIDPERPIAITIEPSFQFLIGISNIRGV